MKSLLLLTAVFLHLFVPAQSGFIRDKDGYVNVRTKANADAAVQDRIPAGNFVYALEEEKKSGENWIRVDYYKKNGELANGYVHRSRVVWLEELPSIQLQLVNDSVLRGQAKGIRIEIRKGVFKAAGHKLRYNKTEPGILETIDGIRVWGADGNIPRQVYTSFRMQTDSGLVKCPATTWNHLYEPNLDMTLLYKDPVTGHYYIEANNSDGAGGYLVIWEFSAKAFVRREIFVPF